MAQWFAIVNRTEARFFSRESGKRPPELLHRMENELGRERNRNMRKDKPGSDRMRIGRGTIVHSLDREKDPHEDAAKQFMQAIAKYLDDNRKKGNFEGLTIYAGPHIAGLLKNHLSNSLSAKINDWRKKNIAKLKDLEVIERILDDEKKNGARAINLREFAKKEKVTKIVEVPGDESDIPQKIVFRDLEHSDAIELAIQKRIDRLGRLYKRTVRCEVVVSAPHKHSKRGKIFHVEVRLAIPGNDLFVSREPEKKSDRTDIYIAIRDAFDAAERMLEDRMRKKKGGSKRNRIKKRVASKRALMALEEL